MEKAKKWFRWLEVPVGEDENLTLLKNPDLQPVPVEDQTWGVWSNMMYWGACSLSMGTWLSGTAALDVNLSYGETLGCFVVGDLVTLAFTLANSYQGMNWKVGYTISQRFVFGTYGSALGILIRILMSIVYYGSNAWLGGLTVNMIISSWSYRYFTYDKILDSSVDLKAKDMIGFIIFHIICGITYFFRPRKMNYLIVTGCATSAVGMASMIIYLTSKTGGIGDLLTSLETTVTGSDRAWAWIYMVSYWFGSVSPASTNQSDFSRFASSKTGLWIGTTIGLMVPTVLVPLLGIIGASCSSYLYGEAYWSPMDINDQWLSDGYTAGARAASFFLGLAFTTAQIAYTISSAGFAGGMDLAGVLPRYFDIKRGAIFTALISFALQPWRYYTSSSVFLTVMYAFGVVMTPMISVMICDNFLIRKQQYPVSDAFKLKGEFYYWYGVNWRAMLAFVLGMAPGIPGIVWAVHPDLITDRGIINFYYADTFTAFAISFFSYWFLCFFFPYHIGKLHDEKDYYHSFTDEVARQKNMIPFSELTEDEINEHNLDAFTEKTTEEKSFYDVATSTAEVESSIK